MAQPEKDPKDDSKSKGSELDPQLDAILPDNTPPEAAELVGDLESYQHKLDEQWESAKAAYEKKIGDIMDEFMHENLRASEATKIAFEPPASTAVPPEKPGFDSQKTRSKYENIMAKVDKELRKEPAGNFLTRYESKPAIISISLNADVVRKTARTGLRLILIGAALTGAFLTYSFFHLAAVTALPYAHTLGPVVAGDRIYVMDWFRKALYVHSPRRGAPIVSVENMPGHLATGLAMSDKAIWTVDGFEKKIHKHVLTLDHQIVASVATPGSTPYGLYFDGTDLWSADRSEKVLYRHRGNDLADIREEYSIPNGVVTALSIRNNRAWVLDGKSREVTVYRLQAPLQPLASFDLDPFLKGSLPTGLFVEGKKVWLVTESPSLLIRIPLSKLEKSRPKAF
jgi:hypothetical protein